MQEKQKTSTCKALEGHFNKSVSKGIGGIILRALSTLDNNKLDLQNSTISCRTQGIGKGVPPSCDTQYNIRFDP
jgi:hypothetical protein